MRKIKFGIVNFPGATCKDDLVYLVEEILEQTAVELWYDDPKTPKTDAFIISCNENYNQCMPAGQTLAHSQVMEHIIKFSQSGGLILGISGGFALLCELGLLPGKLQINQNEKFICQNVFIKADNNKTAMTGEINTSKALKVPTAHGKGRFVADENTLKEMRQRGQIVFRYCEENGHLSEEANPDGSIENIAAVCNSTGNIFGIMPHIERAADDELGNTDSRAIFESIIDFLKR